MEDEKPRRLDWAVIFVWVLFGAIITIILLSRNPDWVKLLELIIQVATGLFSAAAVIAAMGSVKVASETLEQARADRKEEVLSRRPYFTFIEGRLGEQVEDEPSSFVESLFINVGVNPAGDITGHAVFITDMDYEDDVQAITYNPVGDIPSQQQFKFNMAGFNLPDTQDDWHYVVFILHYIDAVTKSEFEQVFYLQGPRHIPLLGLHAISRVVKPRLDSQIAWEELRRKSGHHPSS